MMECVLSIVSDEPCTPFSHPLLLSSSVVSFESGCVHSSPVSLGVWKMGVFEAFIVTSERP